MTTLCTVSPPQLHHSAAAASQLHQSCQLRRALCRPAAARPGPAGPPAVCHPRLQPLTTTTPRLQHPYTTRCRLLDSAWLSQGRDPARLSLGLGHSTVGPNRQSSVSAPLQSPALSPASRKSDVSTWCRAVRHSSLPVCSLSYSRIYMSSHLAYILTWCQLCDSNSV